MKKFVSPRYSADNLGRVRWVLNREPTRGCVVVNESVTPPMADGPVLVAEPWWGCQTGIRVRCGRVTVLTATVDLSDEAARWELARSLAPEVEGYDVRELELALMGLQAYL